MKDLTKNAIAESFKKLLSTRPISRITVKDICTDCSITRQAFYYHFQDVYDLSFWIMERDLREHIEGLHIDRMDVNGYFHAMFDYFLKSRRQVRNGYDAVNRIQYENLFKERAKPGIVERLRSYPEAENVSDEDIDFIASFYTLSLSGILIKWIEEGLPDEYHVRLDKYCMLMDGSMKDVLLKYSK